MGVKMPGRSGVDSAGDRAPYARPGWLLLLPGGLLHCPISRAGREVEVDQTEIIFAYAVRDVAYLPHIPDCEYARPGPVVACITDASHRVLGLLLRRHTPPEELFLRHIGGRGIPA